ADLLRFAAAVERGSEHPLAIAVVKGAEDRGVAVPAAVGFEAINGKGVKGTVEGRAIAVGNRALPADLGVEAAPFAARGEELRRDAQTGIFGVVDAQPAGLLGVADPLKDSTPDAMRVLHEE